MASSSVPGILEPQTLLQRNSNGTITPFRNAGKKWRDGSLNSDIPERELHLLFDVNYTIVSQVNPHIILFFYEREGSAGSPPAHRYGQGWYHNKELFIKGEVDLSDQRLHSISNSISYDGCFY